MTRFLYTTNDLNVVKIVDFFKTMIAYFEKKITTVIIATKSTSLVIF